MYFQVQRHLFEPLNILYTYRATGYDALYLLLCLILHLHTTLCTRNIRLVLCPTQRHSPHQVRPRMVEGLMIITTTTIWIRARVYSSPKRIFMLFYSPSDITWAFTSSSRKMFVCCERASNLRFLSRIYHFQTLW